MSQQDIATRSQRLADAAGVVVVAARRLRHARAKDRAPRATITAYERALDAAVDDYEAVT